MGDTNDTTGEILVGVGVATAVGGVGKAAEGAAVAAGAGAVSASMVGVAAGAAAYQLYRAGKEGYGALEAWAEENRANYQAAVTQRALSIQKETGVTGPEALDRANAEFKGEMVNTLTRIDEPQLDRFGNGPLAPGSSFGGEASSPDNTAEYRDLLDGLLPYSPSREHNRRPGGEVGHGEEYLLGPCPELLPGSDSYDKVLRWHQVRGIPYSGVPLPENRQREYRELIDSGKVFRGPSPEEPETKEIVIPGLEGDDLNTDWQQANLQAYGLPTDVSDDSPWLGPKAAAPAAAGSTPELTGEQEDSPGPFGDAGVPPDNVPGPFGLGGIDEESDDAPGPFAGDDGEVDLDLEGEVSPAFSEDDQQTSVAAFPCGEDGDGHSSDIDTDDDDADEIDER